MPIKLADCLLTIQKDTIITMTLTHAGTLSFQVGDKNIDDIATGMPSHVYPIFDLYGKCDRITILNNDIRNGTPINDELPIGANFAAVALESDRNVPQCEKGNLEVHEKEIESLPYINNDGM